MCIDFIVHSVQAFPNKYWSRWLFLTCIIVLLRSPLSYLGLDAIRDNATTPFFSEGMLIVTQDLSIDTIYVSFRDSAYPCSASAIT